MSTYVVTGGTGFLGSHLTKNLIKDGHKVKILARTAPNKKFGNSVVEGAVTFQEGSVCDKKCLQEVFDGSDGVFHLAGVVQHSRRPQVQETIYETNVNGTINVIEAAAKSGIKRVVYASTSGTVAVQNEEDNYADDDSPYAMAETKGLPYYQAKIQAEEKAVRKVGLGIGC
eukprot:TRINITY_DN43543_c0_g2_i1.p2 TRINITY_DN43543_c0_g2~~TRINITY_DN43543_c0_g2_i1.p2  ORF type:complete len:171 (-),score=25.79 TRINITY_DN43543_c0_g2_i1:260-772(-)